MRSGKLAAAIAERPELPVEQIESRHVLDALARVHLEDVRDPETRAALEAASVVRRATRSLLAAMLAEAAADGALARLSELSLVERGPAGTGEAMSEERAACWLDVKRIYLENRNAQRLYLATADADILARSSVSSSFSGSTRWRCPSSASTR